MDRRSSANDFYTLLNCDESSSVEQIATEFKLLARKHHPDKVTDPEEKEAAEKNFVLLKKARDVLLDTDMRQKYDQWRAGYRMWISFDDWLKMQSRVHTSIHWATNTPKMASLETSDSSCVSYFSSTSRSEEVGERCGVLESGGGEEGKEKEGHRARGEVSSSLQQFRRSGGGGLRGKEFRNYQL